MSAIISLLVECVLGKNGRIGPRYGFFYHPKRGMVLKVLLLIKFDGGRRPSSETERESGRTVLIEDAAMATVAALTVPPGYLHIVEEHFSRSAAGCQRFRGWLGAAARISRVNSLAIRVRVWRILRKSSE
jgi:hypothetical protein